MTTSVPDRRPAVVAFTGIAGLVIGAVLILLLALIPPTDRISVLRQTISQYGVSDNRWVFNVAVLLVAAASALLLSMLWFQDRLPVTAAVLGALWTVCLFVIVAFPRGTHAVTSGFEAGGTLHRIASVVAFVCLPLAVLVAARAAFPDAPGRRFTARLFAVLSLAWFAVILGAIAVAAVNHQRWWEVIPLGLVERGMALTGLIALAVLAAPVLRRAHS